MSNSQGAAKPVYANFNGMDAREDGNSFITEAWNIDFEDGAFGRRKGKTKVFNVATSTQKPLQVVWAVSGSDPVNITSNLTDGNSATVVTNPFAAANSWIYVGFPYKPHGLQFTITTPNGATASTVACYAQTATTVGGTATLLTVTDGTATGGRTMAQSGSITWNPNSVTWEVGLSISDQTNGLFSTSALQMFDLSLYWVRIQTSTTLNCVISEIRGVYQGTASYGSMCELSALTEFISRSGDRFLVGIQDSPSRYVDASQGNEAEIKIFKYDLNRNEVTPISVPVLHRARQNIGMKTTFVTFNGWLIGSTSAGFLWRYDGQQSAALEALQGMDAQLRVVGAKGYLTSAPRGTVLGVYHNRLMVTRNPDSPLTFYMSLPDNDIITIPPEAPVGGPNVWDISGVFNIPGVEGDFIQSAAVINDRYVILTRNQIWVFDETSLRKTNGEIGCVSPSSVQVIDESIFYLSDDGIYVTDGANSVCISDPVKPFMDKYVNMMSAQFCAVSGHNKKDNEYWLWLPVRGEEIAQVAFIFNYKTKAWRLAGKWFVFGDLAYRDAYDPAGVWKTSAACTSKQQDGKFGLVSCDDVGNLYLENDGQDDNGVLFMSYAKLREFTAGEDYENLREWYLLGRTDGAPVNCVAMGDNSTLEQTLNSRLIYNVTIGEWVSKRLILNNAVDAAVSPLMTGATWGAANTSTLIAKYKKIKFSFGRNQTKMTPVVQLPGGDHGGVLYTTNPTSSRGFIKEIQFSYKKKPGGR